MADTFTTNLNLTKPEPGAAEDTWGISLNSDLDTLDAIFSSSGTQVNLNPNQVNFADDKKAIFGTGGDLEIYHDGSHSYIKDAGTGQIKVLAGTNFQVLDAAGTNFAANFSAGGESQLYYNGNLKLKTAGSGIDVTGTVTSDGLTVQTAQGDIAIANSASSLNFARAGTNYIRATDAAGHFKFVTGANDFATQRLNIAANGDISFYDDTGTTQGLFWDASTERLGIGTTSPSQELVIRSAQPTILLEDSDNNAFGSIEVSSGNINISADGGSGIASSNIDFLIDGSQKIRIDSDGQLGIGTTSPSSVLEIADSGVELKITDTRNQSFTVGDIITTLGFYSDDASGSSGAANNLPRGAIDMVTASTFGSAHDMVFRTRADTSATASEKLRITSSGNVGISGATTIDDGNLQIGDSDADFNIAVAGARSKFGYDSSNNSAVVQGGVTKGIIFCVNNNTLGSGEAGRFSSNGYFGIGTSSPQDKLSIEGGNVSINNGSAFQVGGSVSGNTVIGTLKSESGVLTLKADSTRDVQFGSETNGTAMFIEGSNGNVGIGTTSPNAPLHIANGTPAIRLEDTSAGVSHYLNSNNAEFRVQASGSLALYTAGNNRVHINNTGSVGIGTISPSYLLDVESSSTGNVTLAQFKTNESTYNGLLVAANNNAGWIGNGTLVADEGILFQDTSSAMRFYTASSERMRIDSSGNVGIGTTNPSSKLDVEGSSSLLRVNSTSGDSNIDLRVADTTSSNIINFGDSGSSTAGRILYRHTGDSMAFNVAGSEAFRVINGGNFGIGTYAPNTKLHVKTDTDGDGIKIQRNSTTAGTYGQLGFSPSTNDAGTPNVWIRGYRGSAYTDNYMTFGTGGNTGSERMRIDSSGNLLVGQTSQSPNTVGISLNNNGNISAKRDGGIVALFNRATSDGEIISIRKDDTTVGSIGVVTSDNLYIQGNSTHNGLAFGSNALIPFKNGAYTDNVCDIGGSSNRFKDLHLSGTAYIGTQLGLGTTNPGATLDVTNASGQAGIDVDSFTNNNSYISFKENGTSRFSINHDTSGNALTIYNSYGSSEAMRITSSGELLLNKTSASVGTDGVQLRPSSYSGFSATSTTALFVNRNTTDGDVVEIGKNGVKVGSIGTYSGDMVIGTGDTGVRYDDNVNALIPWNITNNTSTNGTIGLGYSTVKFTDLHLSGTANVGDIEIGTSASYTPVSGLAINAAVNNPAIEIVPTTDDNNADTAVLRLWGTRFGTANRYSEIRNVTDGSTANNELAFNTNGSEAMRIESGNLLVGKTTNSIDTVGGLMRANGQIGGCADGNYAAVFNRKTSDGDIILFRADTTTVGSIGTYSGGLVIGNGDTGLRMQGSINAIYAFNTTTGANRDDAIDLGASSVRFQNLHLSNAVKNESGALAVSSGGGGQLLLQASAELTFTANASERGRFDTSGNLLVGKTVSTIGTAGVKLYGSGALDSSIASGNTYHVYDTVNSAFRFYVGVNGTIHATNTSISAISDKRLKENIKDLETGLKEVLSLKPRRFDWKDKTSKNVAGFIAQEVEEVLPDLIGDYKHSELKDAKSVRMGDMLPTLVKAIQEQQEQIESLKSEIAKLKGE